MNFIYVVFTCAAFLNAEPGACHAWQSGQPTYYESLRDCTAGRDDFLRSYPSDVAARYDLRCFKKPTWTDASGDDEADRREERELSKPGPEAPDHEKEESHGR